MNRSARDFYDAEKTDSEGGWRRSQKQRRELNHCHQYTGDDVGPAIGPILQYSGQEHHRYRNLH